MASSRLRSSRLRYCKAMRSSRDSFSGFYLIKMSDEFHSNAIEKGVKSRGVKGLREEGHLLHRFADIQEQAHHQR